MIPLLRSMAYTIAVLLYVTAVTTTTTATSTATATIPPTLPPPPPLLHPFNDLFSRKSWASRARKAEQFSILIKQETMG